MQIYKQLWIIFFFQVEFVLSVWILNNENNFCDKKCLNKLISEKQLNGTKCIHSHISQFALKNVTEACFIKVSKEANRVTIKRGNRDHRIECRLSKDILTWYRGYQSITVSGAKCLRWDSISHPFHIDNFSILTDSSSIGFSQHENYCRNPDENQLGPWCFVSKNKKEPCFHPCISSLDTLCLSKQLFPYSQLYSIPLNSTTFSSRILSKTTSKIKEENDLKDLSDILDVSSLLPISTYPLFPAYLSIKAIAEERKAGGIISSRNRCYQSGVRSLIFGPWTSVDPHLISEIFFNFIDLVMRILLGYDKVMYTLHMTPIMQHRQMGIYSIWTPCYSACYDDTIRCWPIQKPPAAFPYFGKKSTTIYNEECMKWTEVTYHYINYINTIDNDKTKKKERLIMEQFDLLFNKEVSYRNLIDFKIYLMHSGRCLDLSRIISHNNNLTQSQKDMMDKGPGCFVKKPDQKWDEPLQFNVCYVPCQCHTVVPPISPIQKLCSHDGKYSICSKNKITENMMRGRELAIEQKQLDTSPFPISYIAITILSIIGPLTAIICFFVLQRKFT